MNKNGLLEKVEVAKLVEFQIGRVPSETQVNMFFDDMDIDKDGKVTLHEFIANVHGPDWKLQK